MAAKIALTRGQEIEVKIRLADAAAHAAAMALFGPRTALHQQQNEFFDTPDGAMGAARAVCRLRFTGDGACMATLKAGAGSVHGGIARLREDEAAFDAAAGREYTAARRIPAAACERHPVLAMCVAEFGKAGEGLVGLGGFENTRSVFSWRGWCIEVDETHFVAGERETVEFEIECETERPEEAKEAISSALRAAAVAHSDMESGKFSRWKAFNRAE